MIDVEHTDTLNGGDVVLKGNDLSKISGWSNMVYEALFGGNVEQSTQPIRSENELDESFWANALLWPSDQQLNSETERVLNNVTINSSGRVKIEQAAMRDLAFMKNFATVRVETTVEAVDRIRITVYVSQPDGLNEEAFTYIWDGTLKRLVE